MFAPRRPDGVVEMAPYMHVPDFHGVMRVGMQARSMIAAAVFKKSLTLTSHARQDFTQGQILNLMQLDAMKVEMAASNGFTLIDGIYQIALYVAFLIVYIGPSALAGLAAMLVVIPFQVRGCRATGRVCVDNLCAQVLPCPCPWLAADVHHDQAWRLPPSICQAHGQARQDGKRGAGHNSVCRAC